jgi:hypothetical protein
MSAAAILLAVLVVAGEPEAAGRADDGASPSPASAETLFRRGVDAYDEGRYDAALRSFQEAYRIAPEPSILFNMAQAYRAIGDCRKALEALDAVITANGADRSLVNRARAKRDELERCASAQAAPDPPPPVDVAASTARTAAPAAAPVPLTTLVLSAPPAQRPRSSWRSSRWGTGCMVAAGTAIGFGTAGTGLAWAAHDRADVVNAAQTWTADVQAADSERHGLATAATATFVASAVAALLSGAMCWLGWRRRE